MTGGANHSSNQLPVHENSLDFLRLLAAIAVVLSHLFWLLQNSRHETTGNPPYLYSFGSVGVATFFVISGYVNYLSLEAHSSKAVFYLKRFVRIAPAYAVVVCAQTILFLLVFRERVDWHALPGYFAANILTLNFLMPSFVRGIEAINASLWTIKIELMYYLLLPFLMPYLRQAKWLVAGIAASLAFAILSPNEIVARQLPGVFYLFLLGILLARAGRVHWIYWAALLIISVGLYLVTNGGPTIGDIGLYVIGMPVSLVAIFAKVKWVRVRLDVSYSLYLVHFPVILFALTSTVASSLLRSNFAMITATLVVAVLLTLLIERPALATGRKIIRERLSMASKTKALM